MRRVRVLGVGSDDKPLLQHRREVVPVEVNPTPDSDRLGNVDEDVEVIRHDRIRKDHDTAERLHATQKLHGSRLLLVIQKECPMRTTPRFASSLTAGGYSLLIR